jgi:AMP nucleosidase
MAKRILSTSLLDTVTPENFPPTAFHDAIAAVDALEGLYDRNTRFLRDSFEAAIKGDQPHMRYRAYYPEVRMETLRYDRIDSRMPYGFLSEPGLYSTTITQPKLFRHYLKTQIGQLIANHGLPVTISESATPIPLHFAFGEGANVEASAANTLDVPLRDLFDTPDLSTTDDEIANGEYEPPPGGPRPLAPFTAQRIDYSLARLSHYTATRA